MSASGLSTVSILGGTFGGDDDDDNYCRARDSAMLNITGGTLFEIPFEAYDSSIVSISGGAIRHDEHEGVVEAHQSSTVEMTGGVLEGALWALDSSAISLSGGTVEVLRAGSSSGLHTSVITIEGAGFNYPYGEIPELSGTLTGILANGDPIDAPFEIYGDASIRLVPEPRSAASLVALGVAASVFAVRGVAAERRRRQR